MAACTRELNYSKHHTKDMAYNYKLEKLPMGVKAGIQVSQSNFLKNSTTPGINDYRLKAGCVVYEMKKKLCANMLSLSVHIQGKKQGKIHLTPRRDFLT